MKLESEPGFGLPTPPRKSYNPFESDDDDETSESKPANGFEINGCHGFDIKGFEQNSDAFTFHFENGNFVWEEAIFGHPPVVDNAVSAPTTNGDENLYRKDMELYTDKDVLECELPELMVCYKENVHQSVKDIGVDEGVPSRSKIWVRSAEDHVSDGDVKQDFPVVKSLSDDAWQRDGLIQSVSKDSMKGDGLDHDVMSSNCASNRLQTDDDSMVSDDLKNATKEESRLESNISSRNGLETNATCCDVNLEKADEQNHDAEVNGNGASEEKSAVADVHLIHGLGTEHSLSNPSNLDVTEAKAKSIQIPITEQIPPLSSELSVSKETDANAVTSAMSYDSKVESSSIILDFNASTSSSVKEEEKPQPNSVCEKSPEAQTMSRHEAPGSAGILDERVDGETSFSAAASIMVHSGSVSLRSESSAGSTRSFAFPVLQTEWNSSPVRMTKADQRHFCKQKGWVHSLFCC